MTTFAEHIAEADKPSRQRSKLREWVQRHVNYEYDDCCLIWPFGRHKDGYGTIIVDGRITAPHRYMCRLVHGEPPTPKHQASHSCNRGHDGCVNPHHLRWKTPGDNHKEGEWHAKIKLTVEKAAEIRALKGLELVEDTAKRYGVREITVRQIQSGRIWRAGRRKSKGFTDEQVRDIRMNAGIKGAVAKLAEQHAVSQNVIRNIMSRRSWLHVPDEPITHHTTQGKT